MPDQIEVTYANPQQLPPNFREVEEAEFVKNAMRRIYAPERMEYRQFHSLRRSRPELPGDLMLHWYYNGKGDAISLDYFSGKVRFFLFSECEHTFGPAKNLGRCYNQYTCTQCGYTENIDSGD